MDRKSYKDFYEFASDLYRPDDGEEQSQYYRHDRYFNVRRAADAGGGEGLTILDVGCGNGYQLGALAQRHVVHGLDISEINVDRARTRGLKARQHDIEEPFPFADGLFDVVICSEVLEHLLFPERVLKECYRVLKRTGTLIVTVPNLYSLRNRFALLAGRGFNFIEYYPEQMHIRFFTRRAMTKALADAGFAVTHCRGQHFSMNFDWPFKVIWYLHGGNKGLELLIRIATLGQKKPEVPGLVLHFHMYRFLGWLFPTGSPGLFFECRKSEGKRA